MTGLEHSGCRQSSVVVETLQFQRSGSMRLARPVHNSAMRNRIIYLCPAMAFALVLLAGAQAPTQAPAPAPGAAWPAPIDPQRWQDQDDMTWADYKPIPGTNWGDRSRPVQRPLKVALIAIDFDDQPFVITQKKNSDPF